MTSKNTKSHSPLKHLCFSALICGSFTFFASCNSNDAASSRDFNELIPRITESVKNKTPTEAASNLFNVTSPDERRDAVAYLQTKKWGHEKPYMDAYKVLITDPHPMVRGQAYRALGTSRDQSIVPLLVKGLNDKDTTVRRDAAWALTHTYNDTALDPVIEHAKDDIDEQVRINCIMALVHSRNPKAIRALVDALDDTNAAVVHTAWNNLKLITGEKYPKDEPRAWLVWYQRTYAPPATTEPAK